MTIETQISSNMLPESNIYRICRREDVNDLDYVKKWCDLKQSIAPNNQEKIAENVIAGDNGVTKFNFSTALYQHKYDGNTIIEIETEFYKIPEKFPMIILNPELTSSMEISFSNGKTIYIIPYENKESSKFTSVEVNNIAVEYFTKNMIKNCKIEKSD